MKTIKEMKNEIKHECEKMDYCEMCPLCYLETDCYNNIQDEEVIRNYNIMFGKEEKVLNIDKYRDEIIHLIQENNGDHLGAITTCCINHCGRCSITLGYSFKWLFEEYKEPIQLSQFEYDLLCTLKSNDKFCMNNRNMTMKEKGYFENVDIEMRLQDILSNCEVIRNIELERR